MKKLLPGIKIKAIITIGVSIMITLEDEDNNTGSFLHEWDGNNSYDFWDCIEFKGETYDIHIDNDEEWQVSIYPLEPRPNGEEGEMQVDMSQSVGIYESTNPDSFTIIEQCHISKKPVVFESNGDGTREYDICPECGEKTHPDEMITLPEDDDRMEICGHCYRAENLLRSGSIEEIEKMDNLLEAVIDQIKKDLASNDTTAIEELLKFVPKENLIGYLPEE